MGRFLGRKVNKTLLLVLLLFFQFSLHAKEIIVWHSLDEGVAKSFTELVHQFNQKTDIKKLGFEIVLKYKGEYDDALLAGLSAINTREAPHILQVYEKGNLMMQRYPNAYIPLDKLSEHVSPFLQKSHFIPAASDLYRDRHETSGLASLPFSASSIVLFYNKDAFRSAGLDPEVPPNTWEDFEKVAQVLKKKGAKNILASRWLSLHHIEHMGAWHNQPIATHGNGVDGNGARLTINSSFFKDHFNQLANWYEMGIFSLEMGDKAEHAFAKNDVVMITDGVNHLPHVYQLVNGKFEIGVGRLPFWKKIIEEPYNTAASGSSFWALAGHPHDDYKIVQIFFEYLVSVEVQNKWHQMTGYLPVILGVEELSEKQGFYTNGLTGKAAKIGLDSLIKNPPAVYSRGVLLPNFPTIRDVITAEMKEAIQGKKPVEAALGEAVILGDQIIEGSQI